VQANTRRISFPGDFAALPDCPENCVDKFFVADPPPLTTDTAIGESGSSRTVNATNTKSG
jgi:hypothetical protein